VRWRRRRQYGCDRDPDEGKPAVKATISAAEGGSIATESGNAVLNISKNALPADTEISVAVEAATADTETSVYDFGPDGLQFLVPVELEIKYDGTPGDGEKAALAWYDEATSKWVEVENSSLHAGVVKAKITHFSKFSIILVGEDVVVVSDCANVAEQFTPCGADSVEGTWKWKDVCMADTVIGQNPFADTCPTARADVEVVWDAEITFKGDGTYTTLMNSQGTSVHYDIPMSCLEAYGGASVCVSGQDGMFGEEAFVASRARRASARATTRRPPTIRPTREPTRSRATSSCSPTPMERADPMSP
jgi:hypothetical protein